MKFIRDISWQHRDLMYRSSAAAQLARYALGLRYEMLPEKVVHQAKRCLLDAIGCAIGAYYAPGREMCERVAGQLGGVEEATTIGTGLRTTVLNASLVNSFLIRFLDFNDGGGGGHNSDSIASILAVAEKERSSGQDLLTAIVTSYELGARVTDSLKGPGLVADKGRGVTWKEKGLTPDARAGLSMPPTLGRLMGLTEMQVANAVGICASHSLPLYILDSCREELTMSKNLRFGFGAYHAVLACLLAKEGFTGPIRVVEGYGGLREAVLDGDMDLDALTNFNGWRILDTRHKALAAAGRNRRHLFATLAIVEEQDLKPEDIASITLRVPLGNWRNNNYLGQWRYPRKGESADHSAYFITAITVKERRVDANAYREEKFSDPVILDLVDRITMEVAADEKTTARSGESEITTKDGRRFSEIIDVPHGTGDDPLSDAELEEKFFGMAKQYMGEDQIKKIFAMILDLEKVTDVSELMALTVFPRRKSAAR